MEVTGKAKESFEKWMHSCKFEELELNDYGDLYEVFDVSYIFEQLPESMQYGVYVDWFDSVGVEIEITQSERFEGVWCYYFEESMNDYQGNASTRHKARTKAINKANTIYNETI